MDENDRAVTAFTMLGHGTFHSYELVVPVFVVIWLDVFATTTAVLGVVVGASYALVGLGAIPSGILADRYSAKRVVLGCIGGMGAAFALVALAPTVPVLAVALLLWGLAGSLYHPAALALISRGTKQRETAFAYHGVAGNVGVATGPLLASLLLVGFHWRFVAGILVLPAVLALISGARLEFDETAGTVARGHPDPGENERVHQNTRNDSEHGNRQRTTTGSQADNQPIGQPQTVREFLGDSKRLLTGGFVVVLGIGMLYGIYYRGVFTFLPDVLAGLPMLGPVERFGEVIEPSQYVYSGLLLLGGLGQYAGGKLAERTRIEYALTTVYLALVAVALLFIVAMAAGLLALFLVAGLLGLLSFMAAPINQEAIAAYSSPAARGLSFGYTYTAIFGIGAVGATLAGVVLARWSPTHLFGILACCGTVAAVLCGSLLWR